MKIMSRVRLWAYGKALRLSGILTTWAHVGLAKQRRWDVPSSAVSIVSREEQNHVWDQVRGRLIWGKTEADILTTRLARRFDPGMALNEATQRAIAERKRLEAEGKLTEPTPVLTDRQQAALAFQEQYLRRIAAKS